MSPTSFVIRDFGALNDNAYHFQKKKMHVGVLHHKSMRWYKSWVLTSNVVCYELPHVWVTHSFTWTNSHQCTFMYIDTCVKGIYSFSYFTVFGYRFLLNLFSEREIIHF